jgi:transposase
MKKRDGRTLDRKTMETMRMDAVARVRAGEKVAAVMRSYRLSRTTYYKWTRRMAEGGGTVHSLKSRKAPGGRARLNPAQKQQVRRWVVGKDPRQYGFDFGLWTRAIVRDLIRKTWAVDCSVETVGRLLKELEITPQRPLTRAWQRDPKAIRKWRQERFGQVQREAKACGAEILFLDEAGFRADAQMGRTWGRRGKTPVIERDGRRPAVNALGSVSSRGAFHWHVFSGPFNAGVFVEYLKALRARMRRPVVLVLDRHPVHVSAAVRRYVESAQSRLKLEFLPAYAPELNPQEQAWRYAKRTGTSRTPLRRGETMQGRVQEDLASMSRRPRLIRSFFEQPDTDYIVNAA